MKTTTKLHFLVPLVLAAGLVVIIAVFSHRGHDALVKAEEARLATTAELYASAIRNVMLSGEAFLAPRITSSLKSISGFEDADLYRTDGSSAFHDFSTLNFVNSRQNRISFPLTARRTNEPSSDPILRETAEAAKARTVVLGKEGKIDYWYPLLNFVECRQCHGGSPFVRGVLHLSASTATIRKRETEDLIAVSAWGVVLVAATTAGMVLVMRGSNTARERRVEPREESTEQTEGRDELEPRDRPADFLESLKFTAEELAASLGRKVRLDVTTNGIFPLLPDSIREPLVRLVRNAVGHGIEAPEERLAADKPEEGRIRLSFEGSPATGFKVVCSDDGRGLDFLLLQDRARTHVPAGAVPIPKDTLLRLLFVSGLGKKGKSGLAEVYETAKRNRWKLSVATKSGGGTRITLSIPPS